MKKHDLLKHMGDIAQYAGIRAFTLEEGSGRGCKAYEVYNAAGLRFTVIADNCLDILALSFEGDNYAFITKNGMVSGARFDPNNDQFLYGFVGGMLRTCGVSNAGGACDDNGVWRTMHGRIGFMPAENLFSRAYWQGDDYILEVGGDIRESRLFGYNFVLHRTISTSLFSTEVTICDTLENLQPHPEEFMMLYHCNFGYPLLDEGARIYTTNCDVKPRNDYAASDMRYDEMDAPDDNIEERCYFHKSVAGEGGLACAALVNEKLGKAGYVKYTANTLPVMVEWKSMTSHDYALGLEPSNSFINGRALERQNGTLPVLEGYGKRDYEVRIGACSGKAAIEALVQGIKSSK